MSQMNSVAMQNGKLHVKQIDIPTPGPGQVLVKSLACGICGSDIHITRHTSDVFDIYKNLGIMAKDAGDDQEVLLGHEYAAEIVSYGPNTKGELAKGTRVTSVPILLSAGGAGVGVTLGYMVLILNTLLLMKPCYYLFLMQFHRKQQPLLSLLPLAYTQ
ncbi:alcohol dehydrogenase catalytic domain-containing protein [Pseudoalteromonas sp. Hal040]|uniref:alcohol dehydrogenase catalytic domain-containing protein n=1 Tax=Pseudoalteromonas sp. Hal040 TaxID=3035157 RepID=UPI00301E330E